MIMLQQRKIKCVVIVRSQVTEKWSVLEANSDRLKNVRKKIRFINK